MRDGGVREGGGGNEGEEEGLQLSEGGRKTEGEM